MLCSASQDIIEFASLNSVGSECIKIIHFNLFSEFFIVNRFSLNKDETIFIDDNLRNILAAEEFGIRSIHFKSPELLKSSLEELNLL
jgi:hypothetical protein